MPRASPPSRPSFPLKGTVAASDAFFPFRDGLDEIARAGATALIQPGRLGQGRGGHRRRRRAQDGDGVHGRPALPPLSSPSRLSLRIALLSAAVLFLEMLLVRWVGTEVRIFAYLQNSVLVSAFLGLGLGCRNADRPVDFRAAALSLVAIGLFIRDPLGWQLSEAVTQGLTALQDSAVWGTHDPHRRNTSASR